ncbi:putative flavoprotein involved in K+ transport [Marchantia polymorpha subsp. ruderalis]|uniref:indole-3-pyruvate monooxygenase n=2 Tax=Marchantia polymorpha TaxID=3197 RepID=A0AAF6BME2_MARPO|nr:hypothetical protein MARPO_0052s0062 [Marchantia polymorpha]BBN13176.1 hypothetical protein Mp_6g01420 [Marchantia polymorpha subsp. ruderalis]|eukprot:PTQ38271.1 hypothetical protein MARPO_0052s0062 [Marchantia polymorpha]
MASNGTLENGSSDNSKIVKAWLSYLDEALQKQDIAHLVTLFDEEECFWRDMLAFTWNLYTAESRDEIAAMMNSTLATVKPSGWELDGEVEEKGGALQVFLKFETSIARGRGHLRLKGGKCWTLLTAMTELKGYEEHLGSARPMGVKNENVPGRKTWLEERMQERQELGYKSQPYCVIVGGGQAGIALAARLRMLNVPALIIEKNARPGDSWRNRYKSLCLHDPVWYDHLPYLPFPSNWPVFSPKDKMGDWLEAYTNLMELNYWSSTECKSCTYNSADGVWEVSVVRSSGGSESETIQLRPQHLVLATGMSGMPNVPKFPGAQSFEGLQCHSSKFQTADDWKGKQCVVIGSNTSAHDICSSLWETGAAQVTMVQRSSTHVLRVNTCLNNLARDGYGEGGPPVDTVDLAFASVPYKIFHSFAIPAMQRIAKAEAPFYEGLSKAGFVLDWGADGSGLFTKYLRRGGGYYIDVGASELISNGSIKLKSGVSVQEIKPKSIVFSDGSELPADLIVYATGYGNMNQWAAKLISQEVADKVGMVWGLGSNTTNDPGPWEKELRNMWKPTQQPGLWFMGGNLHQCRHYSLVVALQLKARLEGIPTPVYALPKVNHA